MTVAEATTDVLKAPETQRREASPTPAHEAASPEHEPSRALSNEGLMSVLDRPRAAGRPNLPPELTPALLMRLQAPSGNAAVAALLATRPPVQAPGVPANARTPTVPRERGREKPPVASAPVVAPPPAVESPIADADAAVEAPSGRAEEETESHAPPPGATDEQLERLDGDVDEAKDAPAEPAEAAGVEEEAEAQPEAGAQAEEGSEAPTSEGTTASVEAPAESEDAAPTDEGEVKASAGTEVEAVGESGGDDDAAAAAGAGGGEAPTAMPERPQPEVPDFSQHEPAQAMGAAASLPPAQLLASLQGVNAAGSRAVAGERAALAASPPRRRPSLPLEAAPVHPNGHGAAAPVSVARPVSPESSTGQAGPDGQQLQQHRRQLDHTVHEAHATAAPG